MSEPFDPRKTYLDMEPPRFDVGGNKITGEFDKVNTPTIDIVEEPMEEIEPPRKVQYAIDIVVGMGIGVIIFALGWICAASLIGMH